jgi:CheY-like chemotaxis protein
MTIAFHAKRRQQSTDILIAEDDKALGAMLAHYLSRFTPSVRVTASPTEARAWLEANAGPLVLDGSVYAQMGIPLSDLPAHAMIWSGDRELVERARGCGLAAFVKGSVDELVAMLHEVCPVDES